MFLEFTDRCLAAFAQFGLVFLHALKKSFAGLKALAKLFLVGSAGFFNFSSGFLTLLFFLRVASFHLLVMLLACRAQLTRVLIHALAEPLPRLESGTKLLRFRSTGLVSFFFVGTGTGAAGCGLFGLNPSRSR